jgi:hypothetical protein
MQKHDAQPANESDPLSMKVVVVYEDMETGHRAMKICNHLHQFQGAEEQFRLSLWNYAIFRLPELRDLAAYDAAPAALIIVSTHGQGDVPQEVQDWFDLWLQRRIPQESALVAILDAPPDGDQCLSPIQVFLKKVADQAGMDFFCQHGESAGSQPGMDFPIVKFEALTPPVTSRPSIPR